MNNLATKNTSDFNISETGDAFISQSKAADTLGIPVGTLKSYVFRNHSETNTINGLSADVLESATAHYAMETANPTKQAKDFYRMLAKAGAKAFIYHEAGYTLKAAIKTPLQLAKEQVLLLEQLDQTTLLLDNAIETKAEIGSRREATAMNTASQAVKKANKLETKLDQSKQFCTVKRMEMLKHGQKFSWRLLKSTGIEMGIKSIDVFDANYGTVKAYHVDVWYGAYAINLAGAS